MVAPIDRPIVCPVTVGREKNLELLDGILASVAQGNGQTVLVAGEAGIGKSRMVAEVRSRAHERGFFLLQGNCFETDRSLPYAPILDMLRLLLASFHPEENAADWQPYAPDLVKLLPELQQLLPGPVPTPALDPEQEKRRIFEAVCGLLNSLALSHPLLVVVEDLHWTDDTSLDFLLFMARRIVQKPVLLVATYRSDEVTAISRFLATLDRERLAAELPLGRLPIHDVEAMVRAIFDLQAPIRGEFLDTIYSLTEGNAFFIEEVLKSLISSGGIFYQDGAWERKPMQELHIPRSVHDAVQRRTAGLSEEARRALALAAVVGRRFDFPLLQSLTGYDETAMLAVIKELIGAQLVTEESYDLFAFRHALTRRAVYSDLLARERKSLHRTIAETIKELYVEAFDSHVADLAYHCYEAGIWDDALEYSRRAGESAQALYAPKASVEHFTRAIEAAEKIGIAGKGDGMSASLYLLRGQAYETLGEFDRARSDYDTSLAISRQSKDIRAEWQALLELGKLWAGRDYGPTGDYFQQALALARTMEDPAALAHSLNRMGNWYSNVDQPYNAIPMHQEALDIFEAINDKQGLADSADLLGMTNYLNGDLLRGSESYRRAIKLFTELNDKQGLCSSLAMLPLCSAATYHTDTLVGLPPNELDGIAECLQALNIARGIGWRAGEAFSLWMLCFCLGMRGDYDLALAYGWEGMAISRDIGHSQWITASGGALSCVLIDVYALGQARSLLEETLVLAKSIGSSHWLRTISAFLASCCIEQRDFVRAEEVLDAVMPPGVRWHTFGQRRCWQARIELALATGKYERAIEIIDMLYSNVQPAAKEPTLSIPRLAMLKGQALMGLGRLKDAASELEQALEKASAHRSLSLVWRIQLSLGNVYAALSRPEEAGPMVALARTLTEQLAAKLPDEELREVYLQATSRQFPRTSEPPLPPAMPRRASGISPGGLTGRELEVAILVAQGKSNRDIADELVLGERTIETHVGNTLSKLGFTSRAQIAAWVVENVTHKR